MKEWINKMDTVIFMALAMIAIAAAGAFIRFAFLMVEEAINNDAAMPAADDSAAE